MRVTRLAGHGWRALRHVSPVVVGLSLLLAPTAQAHNRSKSHHAVKAPTATHAQATGPASPSDCSQPSLTQAFLSDGDFNYYAPAPGPAGVGFNGSSWTLSGGAQLDTTQRADGGTGQVLSLPAGSQVVSPDMCIMTSQNPLARAMVRSLDGAGGLQVQISYEDSGTWSKPQGAGGVNGQGSSWTASNTINIPPGPPGPPGQTSTWEIVRFTFTAPSGPGSVQMYGLGVAAPPPVPSTGACSNPVLSQAFLPAGDTNYYTAAPGQTGGGFVGTGWTLTGGAKIVTATRSDDSSGPVLDLPAGSLAVSPNICVTSLYPTARMMVRSLFGGDDLSFRVSYADTNTWTNPHETGHVHGNDTSWTLSDPVQLQPPNQPGWQIVADARPNGAHSEFQIYDLELDPYARG